MRDELNHRSDKLTGCLEIRDMIFHSAHGIHLEERIAGGKFIVSCWLNYRIDAGQKLDDLKETIDYQEVFHIVEEIMNNPVNLIEELAKAIFDQLLDKYPVLTQLKIRVEKHDIPVKGLGLTAFELSRDI